jgi:hypothetical protein
VGTGETGLGTGVESAHITDNRRTIVVPLQRKGLRDGRGKEGKMAHALSYYAVPVAIGAVAVVLLLGLANMLRGGSPNMSQKLMRWRVVLQFVAIVVIMLTIWAMGR